MGDYESLKISLWQKKIAMASGGIKSVNSILIGTPMLHPKVADIMLEDKRESQGRSSKVEPFRSFLRDKSYLCGGGSSGSGSRW